MSWLQASISKQASLYQKFGFLGTDRLGCTDDFKRFEFDSYLVSLSVAQASTSRFDTWHVAGTYTDKAAEASRRRSDVTDTDCVARRESRTQR